MQLANDFEEMNKFKGVHSADILGVVHTLLDEFNLVSSELVTVASATCGA